MPQARDVERNLLWVEGEVRRAGVPDAKRLRALEEENARLKRVLADTMLDNAGLKDLLPKYGSARREAASGRASSGDAGDE